MMSVVVGEVLMLLANVLRPFSTYAVPYDTLSRCIYESMSLEARRITPAMKSL